MKTIKVTDKLSVSGQPALDDFGSIASEGFAAVLNHRPDGEEAAQPGSDAEQWASRESGLGYEHIPVANASTITEADVRRFQSVVAASNGPVLAHCKSGTRALSLHAIGEVLDGRLKAEDIRSFGEKLGFDLSGAAAWLAKRGAPS